VVDTGSLDCIYSAAALAASLLIDRHVYGAWVAVQYEFVKFNVVHNVAAFYGTHPWHWYLSQVCACLARSWCPINEAILTHECDFAICIIIQHVSNVAFDEKEDRRDSPHVEVGKFNRLCR
jgi:hypothetical protein